MHWTGRGGQFTYHGPGQRVAYAMLDLKRRREDVRAFVAALEAWLIDDAAGPSTCAASGARTASACGWRGRSAARGAEDKIAAIGIRLRRWVSFHGISLNVEPDLEHFSGIVPCGVRDHGVTSLVDLGLTATMADVDLALRGGLRADLRGDGLRRGRSGCDREPEGLRDAFDCSGRHQEPEHPARCRPGDEYECDERPRPASAGRNGTASTTKI